jgi:hypothetical protein
MPTLMNNKNMLANLRNSFRKMAAKNRSVLEVVYIIILLVVFVLTIITPSLISEDILVDGLIIREEWFEGILIALLFIIGYTVINQYRKELVKNQSRLQKALAEKTEMKTDLDDALKYIGSVNVQLGEVKSIIAGKNKYPEHKRDLKELFQALAQKSLGIVNADWSLLRIIDPDHFRTLGEHFESRGHNQAVAKLNVSNKALVETGGLEGFSVLQSDQANFRIKTFCVMPIDALTDSQKILLKVIVNQIEMFFIIYSSQYYNKINMASGTLPK